MLSVKRKIAKKHDMMATQTESYVNFRWGDSGTSPQSKTKTIHLQSPAKTNILPLIVRKLVGATDGAVKDFVVNRAHYKRQYLRFVHMCCEEDSKKDKAISGRFLLDLISKALQNVLVERSKDFKTQASGEENVKLLYEVSIRVYDCKNFEYPNNEEWDLYDGVLWSGSTFASQRNDELWVIRLKDEIRRKIIAHKRKTIVISLGRCQTQQTGKTDKPPLHSQNSCRNLIPSASDTQKEDEEQHADEDESFMVRFQATQEYNFWCKAATPSPASISEMRSEQEETLDESKYNVLDHVAETFEKFGWFPSADTYRVLAKKIVSNSSFSTLGSYGSTNSFGSTRQFYKNFSAKNEKFRKTSRTNLLQLHS